MDTNRYKDYREKDFLTDEYFHQWVSAPDAESDAFWQSYLTNYPQQAGEIEKARSVLVEILATVKKNRVSPKRKEKVWRSIATATIQEKSEIQKRSVVPRVVRIRRLAAGIAATLVLGLGLWSVFFYSPYEDYQTAYGEFQKVELSDGSIVNLNAHSSLRFRKDWKKTGIREIWLEGEAYFDVSSKSETGASFIVHTDDLDVEVVGTQFNVKSRTDQTVVVLEEGSVRLNVKNERTDTTLNMTPGQKASYDAQVMAQVELSEVETHSYSSWKEGVLLFDRVSLQQITTQLEEIYGKPFHIEKKELSDKIISASVPVHNKQVFFETLEGLFFVKVTEEQDRIVIQ